MSLARVTVALPQAYVDAMRASVQQKGLVADVRRRVEALGYNSTLLVTQDPTDNRLVSILTRPVGTSQKTGDGTIRVVSVEPVEEPPNGTEKADPSSHPFDPGLSVAEVAIIRLALREESNPRHLWGLAATLEPCFPVAASLLRARKLAIETDTPPTAYDVPPCDARTIRAKRAAVDAYAARQGMTRDLVDESVKRSALLLATGEDDDAPPVVQDLAVCLIRQVARSASGQRVMVVDRTALQTAVPVTGTEGVVPPPAIQLALATCKPEMARVRFAKVAMGRRTDLQGPINRVEDKRAHSVMVRAQKAIERQRWVRWYERDRATS